MSDPAGRPSVVVVAPHYDDAPLSLGQSLLDGALSRCRVRVVVVFGCTNWTRWVHPTRRRAPAVTAWRRLEEAAASVVFGYRFRVQRLEEAILRTGDPDPARLLDPDAPVERDPLVGVIAERLGELRAGAELVLFPAGLGDHVDHRLVAAAGRQLSRDRAGGLGFYEDRPYAALLDEPARRAQLARLGEDLEWRDLSGPVTRRLHRTLRLVYPSQIDELFLRAMDRDVASGAVERAWFPRGAVPPWVEAWSVPGR